MQSRILGLIVCWLVLMTTPAFTRPLNEETTDEFKNDDEPWSLSETRRSLPVHPIQSSSARGIRALRDLSQQRRFHPIHPLVRYRGESESEDRYENNDDRSKKSRTAGELLSILTDMAKSREQGRYTGLKSVRFGISR